jgi:hypothetical protein
VIIMKKVLAKGGNQKVNLLQLEKVWEKVWEKKGILDIAVDKIAEKSDGFMDTESDYHTQNEINDDDLSN